MNINTKRKSTVLDRVADYINRHAWAQWLCAAALVAGWFKAVEVLTLTLPQAYE